MSLGPQPFTPGAIFRWASARCLVVLPDDQQFLAWRAVVARTNLAQAAITNIQPLHNCQAKWLGALDDSTTHAIENNLGTGRVPTVDRLVCSGLGSRTVLTFLERAAGDYGASEEFLF